MSNGILRVLILATSNFKCIKLQLENNVTAQNYQQIFKVAIDLPGSLHKINQCLHNNGTPCSTYTFLVITYCAGLRDRRVRLNYYPY